MIDSSSQPQPRNYPSSGSDDKGPSVIMKGIDLIVSIVVVIFLIKPINLFLEARNVIDINDPALSLYASLVTYFIVGSIIYLAVPPYYDFNGKFHKALSVMLSVVVIGGIIAFGAHYLITGSNADENVDSTIGELEDTKDNLLTNLICTFFKPKQCELEKKITQEAKDTTRTDNFKIGLDKETTIPIFNFDNLEDIKPLTLSYKFDTSTPIEIEKVECYYDMPGIKKDALFATIIFDEPEIINVGQTQNKKPYLCKQDVVVLGTIIDGDVEKKVDIKTKITYSIQSTITKDIVVVNYPLYDLNQEKSVEQINLELKGLSKLIVDPSVLDVKIRGIDNPVILEDGEANSFTMIIDINLESKNQFGNVVNSELIEVQSVSSLEMEEYENKFVKSEDRAFLPITLTENEGLNLDDETRIQKLNVIVRTTFEKEETITAEFLDTSKVEEFVQIS